MISMVAAMSSNNVIGNKGHLPWGHDMPSDIKRYSDLIKGHTIVMGSKTYGEADHARSKSKIVVLSRQEMNLPDDIRLLHNVDEVLALDKSDEELFITGGGGVFGQMIEYADRIYLTRVEEEFEGDVHFPRVDENDWELTQEESHKRDSDNKHDYTFLTYERKR